MLHTFDSRIQTGHRKKTTISKSVLATILREQEPHMWILFSYPGEYVFCVLETNYVRRTQTRPVLFVSGTGLQELRKCIIL
jgi:hypothetical protein